MSCLVTKPGSRGRSSFGHTVARASLPRPGGHRAAPFRHLRAPPAPRRWRSRAPSPPVPARGERASRGRATVEPQPRPALQGGAPGGGRPWFLAPPPLLSHPSPVSVLQIEGFPGAATERRRRRGQRRRLDARSRLASHLLRAASELLGRRYGAGRVLGG